MIAWTATRIATVLASKNDVVYLADDEQQAEALAAATSALCPEHAVLHLPSSDALPGDVAPASPGNVGARVATLRALLHAQQESERCPLALIMSGEAAARRYPPRTTFAQAPIRLAPGDAIEPEQLTATLAEIGYVADDRVDEPGEISLRGDVIDVFPADADQPARIDIANGHVAAIRRYDPVTQRSVGELAGLYIGPAAEPPLVEPSTVLAHLGGGVLMIAAKADERRQRLFQLAAEAAAARGGTIDAIDEEQWAAALAPWHIVASEQAPKVAPRFAEARSPLSAIEKLARPALDAGRTLVLAGSERDLRFLRTKLAKRLGCTLPPLADWRAVARLEPGMAGTLQMPADRGFIDDTVVFIAAADLLGSRALIADTPVIAADRWAADVGEVGIGDVVVHEDYGVAIVAGLEPAPGGDGEMIALEHADGGRRLVALDQADRIWRYGADADAVTLDKLDGSSWQKRRRTIDAAIAESAKGLSALAEARARLTAPVIDPDPAAYERFAGGFAFNETVDQARAIAAVRADLARGTPMDRLVVGDVGYGKTEVALRAAALAALAGHQVVVAAPTTVLVRQHLVGFQQRFAKAGITVASLSRLSSAAEKKAVKAGLADGTIQIVIGTGAVMAKGVTYAKLGLVVIDEEQRFGAADKVRLRGSGEVHLLTLSATPIPRTLQMALIGLQQISVIATPPARRQPIRTSLDQYDEGRIRTALLREKSRGGQSFVIVPRIDDMAPLTEKLRRAVPNLSIVEAHGKLAPAEIDAAMVGFAEGQGDILLATNIVEAGLDVPRANTMIVWRADRFGLAQLHQLRGRVGRGNRRGQVMLLTEPGAAIGERTMKRLRTLAAFDRLGAGFEISAQDLDMRGAGDLLGETQAGHMKLIGVDLYQHLLGAALRAVRGESVEHWTPELNMGSSGALPYSWIPEPDVRLSLYVRLARIADEAGLDAFEDELVDRFGPLPAPTETLLARARLRLTARAAGVLRVDAGPAAIALTPRRRFTGDPASYGLTLKGARLLLLVSTSDDTRLDRVQALLDDIAA